MGPPEAGAACARVGTVFDPGCDDDCDVAVAMTHAERIMLVAWSLLHVAKSDVVQAFAFG
jgi:hypothetical protein